MAQMDIYHALQSTPVEVRGVKVRATLEIDPAKRPWQKASAIFFTMKEHANLDAATFNVRWVTMGLRVDVNCAPRGVLPSMSQLASFTIGGTWKLNAEVLKHIAPLVDPCVLQEHFEDSRRRPRFPSATRMFGPWLFCTISPNRENRRWCCEWLDDLRHKHRFVNDFPCVYALQETDNWTISAMDVPGHIENGRDLGKTAILCLRQVSQFRRSWISHERFTAILVGSTMILSVYMPHSGCDEEEYIATLEAVRDVMGEGKHLGAMDFFIGGDINVELKLEPDHEHLQGLDGIDWYGIYGPECLGGGEDVTTYEKKMRRLQLLREFGCVVTSTWVEKGNPDECYTWRAWGSRVRRKQLDYILGPRDVISSTWYLNKVRIRTWDHFPVVVKIEGKEDENEEREKELGRMDPCVGRRGEEASGTQHMP